jgi:hypothetical protein
MRVLDVSHGPQMMLHKGAGMIIRCLPEKDFSPVQEPWTLRSKRDRFTMGEKPETKVKVKGDQGKGETTTRSGFIQILSSCLAVIAHISRFHS